MTGQRAGRREVIGVVEQRQGLQWRIRARRSDFANSALCRIKQKRRCDRSPPEGIDGAAMLGGSFARFVFEATHKHLFPDAVRLVRPDGWTTERRVQQSRRLQRRVTQHPARQTESSTAREPAIFRIASQQRGRDRRTLLIRFAGNDHLEQSLGVPSMLHEIDRQPIEQFRM